MNFRETYPVGSSIVYIKLKLKPDKPTYELNYDTNTMSMPEPSYDPVANLEVNEYPIIKVGINKDIVYAQYPYDRDHSPWIGGWFSEKGHLTPVTYDAGISVWGPVSQKQDLIKKILEKAEFLINSQLQQLAALKR